MKLYALSQRSGETYDAAGKAMQDVYAILAQKGFRTVWSMPKSCNKYMKILDLPYLAGLLLFGVGKGDYIFYSIPENHMKIKLLKIFQKLKKYQIICFINDLNAFRYGNMESEEVQAKMREEASVIGMADYVLIPNKNTAELLQKNGVASRLVPVGVWDYLMTPEQILKLEQAVQTEQAPQTEQAAQPGQDLQPEQVSENGQPFKADIHIAFAGNLNKSDFLFQMQLPEESNIKLELWGKLDEAKKGKLPDFCTYHGVLPAAEVPMAVAGMDYGLVWDGSGADEIEGGLGEYLQYNNSHKCGLYLASGIPAIVWSWAGMANFVKEHDCGICIDRLGELKGKIYDADYGKLKKNAEKVATELRQGSYLSRAFNQILGSNS